MEAFRKQKTDILTWWKRKYNYSNNDERYLSVTPSQVYSDRLEEIIANTKDDFELESKLLRMQEKQFNKKKEDVWLTEKSKRIG